MSIDLMKRAGLLFVILTASVSSFAQDPEIKKALRFVDIDQSRKAIDELNKAITTYPLATKLYYYLGYVQLKTGETAKALSTFEKGISLNDKDAINHVGLGAVRLIEKKPTEAKAFFDKALLLSKSKDAAVFQAIAEAYLTDAKYAETALKLLEKAKALDPNNAKTFLLMGEVDLFQNKGGPAISNCERASKLDATNGKPYYNIAMVYMRSQNYSLAEENFNKAISVDPEFTLAYKELGELYYSTKNGEQAVKAYESYLKLTENPEAAMLRYAYFLFMAKNYAKANPIFKKLIEKPDATPTTWKYAAYSHVEGGELAEAQKMFEKYYSLVPADKIESSDYNYFAILLQKLKNDTTAIVYLQKSLALTPNQPEIAKTIAETQFKLRKWNESIAAYEVLFKIRKPLSSDYYKLGQAYYNTEQYLKADTIFTKFVEMQPKLSVSYLWLGRTKSSLDPDTKLDFAKAAYEKVIEIASVNPETNGNKRDLIEAYKYMGGYYGQRDNLDQVKIYMEKVLALDPKDAKAIEVLKLLKAPK